MLKKYAISLLFAAMISFASAFSEELRKDESKVLKEETVVTTHTAKINGVDIPYKAIAGNQLLKDDQGHVKASIFYVAYHKENVEDTSSRPITFCFNGGPGSSSVWLHMGAFGPRRILMNEKEEFELPVQIVNNEYSILDLTDLVFIDPVSSGYSRAAPGEDPKQFHGVEEDINSIANFIRLYTTRVNRWDSPKYLAGESYGTTRAAGVAYYLHKDHQMYFDGIVFISTILNFQTIFDGDDLSYVLSLPSFTAAAWYHRKLSPSLQKDLHKTLDEVKSFALQEYSSALMQGDLLSDDQRKNVIQKLSNYTGLPLEYIDHCGMRISILRYAKELLRNQKRTIGRFDSRFLGIDSDACGETFEYDPSTNAVFGPFTAAFNKYVRTDLKWIQDDEYVVLAKVTPWNYGKACNKFLDVGDNLRETITRNPNFKVFVAKGFYDMATPYFAVEYTFNHLGLEPSLRSRITMSDYQAGHMMYIHLPSLIKLKQDLSLWMNKK